MQPEPRLLWTARILAIALGGFLLFGVMVISALRCFDACAEGQENVRIRAVQVGLGGAALAGIGATFVRTHRAAVTLASVAVSLAVFAVAVNIGRGIKPAMFLPAAGEALVFVVLAYAWRRAFAEDVKG